MADRGITFSAPMVRALLDGRKTQTRRLIQPITGDTRPGDIIVSWPADAFIRQGATFRPPHAPGDRLYVREHWKTTSGLNKFAPRLMSDIAPVRYLADDATRNWNDHLTLPLGRHRQAMHMPRWASRLTLLVTDVRVQRLRHISEADARCEGVERVEENRVGGYWRDYSANPTNLLNARESFSTLWNSLHTAPGTRWEDNPWIYAATFDVMRGNIDQIGEN